MEENLHKDEFEPFLRKSTDEFRMIPSRKVWYSIYNDMHPDRRWPSLTVCILILSAVLFIGISNNNSIGNAARRAGQENLNGIARNLIASKMNNLFNPVVVLSDVVARSQKRKNIPMPDVKRQDQFSENIPLTNDIAVNGERISFESQPIVAVSENTDHLLSEQLLKEAAENPKTNALVANTPLSQNALNRRKGDTKAMHSFDNSAETKSGVTGESGNTDLIASTEGNKIAAISAKEKSKRNNNIEFIEDFAFHNKPAAGKFRRNASMSYYVTPSIGYRTLTASNAKYEANLAGTDHSALNFEAGTAINYSLNDRFRVKAGLQVNYLNYVTSGADLGHPTQAQLATTSTAAQLRSTQYATAGNTTLNHTTFQLSIPLGADMLIAGNEKLKWYVGAAVQPGYVLGGNALMLSADGKNLISDKSMRRDFNINTSAETFISYKTGAGVILNAGPQLRYQVLSSFKHAYAYKENLFNTGIRIGLTKTF